MSSEGKKRSVAGTMMLSVFAGAFVGGSIGVVALPSMAAALAIGGAMMGGAIAAAVFMFAGEGE